MIIKVQNETPFQVLTGAFTIGPSQTGYELQVGATSSNFTTLFSVGANTTRMVTNVANGSYYRLKNNVGEVSVNWSRTCVTEGSGGGAAGNELIPQDTLPQTADAGTVVALTDGGIYQYDGTDWVPMGGGGDTVIELTRAEYNALTGYAQDTWYVITDAEEINLDDYATTADTEAIANNVATLSGSVANKADKANITARSSNYYFPRYNAQGIITGDTQVYNQNLNINGTNKGLIQTTNSSFGTIYAPTSAGVQNAVLLSNGSGAPVWSIYKFVFISQADYDALTTKDSTTVYFIIPSE